MTETEMSSIESERQNTINVVPQALSLNSNPKLFESQPHNIGRNDHDKTSGNQFATGAVGQKCESDELMFGLPEPVVGEEQETKKEEGRPSGDKEPCDLLDSSNKDADQEEEYKLPEELQNDSDLKQFLDQQLNEHFDGTKNNALLIGLQNIAASAFGTRHSVLTALKAFHTIEEKIKCLKDGLAQTD